MDRTEEAQALPVTQADRDAAATFWAAIMHFSWADWQADWMRDGTADQGPVVQAFARHRIAQEASPTLDAEAMREAAAKALDDEADALDRSAPHSWFAGKLRERSSRIRALPLPAALSTREWQPIETAPQNQTPIWLGCAGNMRIGWWADGAQHENFGTVGGGWIDMARAEARGPRGLTFAPTHWARIPPAVPAPPAPGGGS